MPCYIAGMMSVEAAVGLEYDVLHFGVERAQQLSRLES